jgi:hypothetical protein
LLVNHSGIDRAKHDVDTLEDMGNGGLVSVVDFGELGALGEPFRVVIFDGVLSSEKPGSCQ